MQQNNRIYRRCILAVVLMPTFYTRASLGWQEKCRVIDKRVLGFNEAAPVFLFFSKSVRNSDWPLTARMTYLKEKAKIS